MITHADLPRELNLATWFVDSNVEEGRGDRVALIGPAGKTTYAELAGLVNRCGNLLSELGVRAEERVLLALGDSVELVALWYGAQKIGVVTAEAYTFLQPKDYAYYLEYTDARVVVTDETTRGAIESVAGGRHVLVVDEAFRDRLADQPAELEPAPTTKDDVALWKFTTGSTGQPKGAVHPVHSPVLSHEWYARGVLGIREDDVVLPVPKLFFGYARDLTALYPFGAGAAGIVFPERTTPERIFDLIAEHRPTILVNVPTMMAQMVALGMTWPGSDTDFSCLATSARRRARRCRASCTTAGSTRSASRCWTGSARPSCTTSTSRTGPAGFAPEAPASSCRATRPSSARTASCWSPATPPRSSTGATTRRRSARSAATRSARATSSSATTTASSGTAAASTI